MLVLSTPQATAQWLRSQASGSLYADSRSVKTGDAFLAWPGGLSDPRSFVAMALQQGAGACLYDGQ